MADPQLLYIVSSVVVMALVAWVIAVLARAPALPYARKNPETVTAAPSAPAQSSAADPVPVPQPAAARAESPPEDVPDRVSRLDAHLEIQDEKNTGGKGGGS